MYYGEYKFADGKTYIGHFHHNKFNGNGKLVFANGLIAVGNFTNGNLDKHAKLLLTNGNIYEGTVNEFEIGNRGKMYYKNGDVYDGYFKEGVRTGFGILVSQIYIFFRSVIMGISMQVDGMMIKNLGMGNSILMQSMSTIKVNLRATL